MRLTFKTVLYRIGTLAVLAAFFLFIMGDSVSYAIGRKSFGRTEAPAQRESKAREIFSLGMSYYERGEYDDAAAAFQAASDQGSKNDEIKEHLKLAQYYKGRQQFEDDLPDETGTRASRKHIYDLYLLGQYALRYKRYEEAIKYFQEVLALNPHHEGAWSKLVEARTLLEKIKRRTPHERSRAAARRPYRKEKVSRNLGYAQHSFPEEKRIIDRKEVEALKREVRKRKMLEKFMEKEHRTALKKKGIAQRPSFDELRRREKSRRKRALMEQLAKKKVKKEIAPDTLSIALAADEILKKENAKRTQEEKKKKRILKELYARSEEMFKRGDYNDALKGFLKITKWQAGYRNTKNYIADIRKIKEAEKREKSPRRYTLGPADVLTINVANHPEFSGAVTVEAGGEIILPLTKEVIMADGLTKEALTHVLEKRLEKFVKSPDVSIVITGYNSKKFYILGEVGIRGEYPLGKTKLTLMEALYQARLPLEASAAMRRVVLIKPHKTRPKHRWIDVYALLYQGKMKDNVQIDPGDIIYVPKTVVNKVSATIGHIISPVTNTTTSIATAATLSDNIKFTTPLKKILTPRTPPVSID